MKSIQLIVNNFTSWLFRNWGGHRTLCYNIEFLNIIFLITLKYFWAYQRSTKSIFVLGKNKFVIRKPLFLNKESGTLD
jgi:hypothetical protein